MAIRAVHIPPPSDDQMWERWCLPIFRYYLTSKDLKRYRARGDTQHGVDLYGHDTDAHLCFVQCKARNEGELTAASVKKDFLAAKKKFSHLRRFIVATTTRSAPKAEDEAIRLMKLEARRPRSKQILIEVLAWAQIVDIVQRNDALIAATGAMLIPAPLAENIDHPPLQTTDKEEKLSDDKSPIGRELWKAVTLMRREKPLRARTALATLWLSRRAKATPKQKYRILLNRGTATAMCGNIKAAAKIYSMAIKYAPDEPRRLRALTLSSAYLGKTDEARKSARLLCKLKPKDPVGWAVLIRTSRDSKQLTVLLEEMPRSARGSQEVLAETSKRWGDLGAFREAVVAARKLLKLRPKHGVYLQGLATAILRQVIEEASIKSGGRPSEFEQKRLTEALSLFDTSQKQFASVGASPRDRAISWANAATAHRLLGEQAAALEAQARAAQSDPSDWELTAVLGWAEWRAGNPDRALAALDRIPRNKLPPESEIVRGCALEEKDTSVARQRLIADLTPRIRKWVKSQPDLAGDAIRLVARATAREHGASRALSFLEGHRSSFHHELAYRVGRVTALGAQTSDPLFSVVIEELAKTEVGDAAAFDKRTAAQLLVQHGKPLQALPILEMIADKSRLTEDTRWYVRALEAAGKRFAIVNLVKALASGGFATEELDVAAVMACIRDEAFELAAQLLEQRTKKRSSLHLELMLSTIGLMAGRRDWVRTRKKDLPNVSDVNEVLGSQVAQFLWHEGDWSEAAEYSYQLWRRFPSSVEVARLVLRSFLPVGPAKPAPAMPVVVDDTCAVVVDDEGVEKTYFIEVGAAPVAAPERGEIGQRSPLTKALLGSRQGEKVEYARGPLTARLIVKQIMHKSVARAKELARDWQQWFPGDDSVFALTPRIKADGTIDVAATLDEMAKVSSAQDQQFKTAEAEYSGAIPCVTNFAQRAGLPIAQAFAHLSAQPTLGVISVFSDVDESQGIAESSLSRGIVVSPTSLALMAVTEGSIKVSEFVHPCVVARPSMRDLAGSKYEYSGQRPNTRLRVHNGQPAVVESSPEDTRKWNDRIRDTVGMIESAASLVDGTVLYELSEGDWAALTDAWLPATAAAIAAAKRRKCVLLVDDVMLARWAQSELGVTTMSTAGYVRILWRSKRITAERAEEISATLICKGIRFIAPYAGTLARVAANANWDLRASTLRMCIQQFSSDFWRDAPVAAWTADSLWRLASTAAPELRRQGVAVQLLSAVHSRPGGQAILSLVSKQVSRGLPRGTVLLDDPRLWLKAFLASPPKSLIIPR